MEGTHYFRLLASRQFCQDRSGHTSTFQFGLELIEVITLKPLQFKCTIYHMRSSDKMGKKELCDLQLSAENYLKAFFSSHICDGLQALFIKCSIINIVFELYTNRKPALPYWTMWGKPLKADELPVTVGSQLSIILHYSTRQSSLQLKQSIK